MIGSIYSRGLCGGLAAVVAVTLAACGGSDEGGGSNEGDVRTQIGVVLGGVQKAFVEIDGEGFCDGLTKAGREEVAGDGLLPGNTCATTVAQIARATRESGVRQRPSVVRSVRVRGSKATAMVSNGGRPVEPVEFAREDGEWRLVSAGLGFQAKTPENADQAMPEKLRRKLLYGETGSGN